MERQLAEAIQDVRRALSQQLEDVVRKTGSLRELARMAVAAMAGLLAGAGLLAQSGSSFSAASLGILAAAALVIVASAVLGVAHATLFDAADLTVGPDPEALRRAVLAGTDPRSLDISRLDALVRMYAYNQHTLTKVARGARDALWSLVLGTALALLGFAFVVGGRIGWP